MVSIKTTGTSTTTNVHAENNKAKYYSELAEGYKNQAGSYAAAAGTSATYAADWAGSVQVAATDAIIGIETLTTDALASISTAVTEGTTILGEYTTDCISVLTQATISSVSSVNSAKTDATVTIEVAKTAALTTINSAKTSALSSISVLVATTQASATEALIWAEGSDAQVQALGGTHSAKEWCRYNSTVNQNDVRALNGGHNQGEVYTQGDSDSIDSRLAEIKEIAHSTFDLSKFTVVGSPTISTDGVMSDITVSNYAKITGLSLTNDNSFKIKFKMRSDTYTTNADRSFLNLDHWNTNIGARSNYGIYFSFAGTGGSVQGITNNNNRTFEMVLEYTANTKVVLRAKDVDTGVWYSSPEVDKTGVTFSYSDIFFGRMNGPAGQIVALPNGSIYLEDFALEVDGVPVLSGNKTGVDTYTINGSTVSIPYTLSKTGSKIVDSYYRTQVTALYEQEGYAPYYTLSDTDFTLPMGELYGMIGNNAITESVSGISRVINLGKNIQLLTGSCTSGTEVTLPNEGFADSNYMLSVPYSAKSATAFTPTQTGDWFAIGEGVL